MCLIIFYLWLVSSFDKDDTFQIKKLRLTENEKFSLSTASYVYMFNNMMQFQQFDFLYNQSLQLLSEKQKYQKYKELRNLFSFLDDNQQFIKIYILDQSSLTYNYRVFNQVMNDEIIIEEIQSTSILINETNCTNLHYLKEGKFIMHCNRNSTTTNFVILHEDGLVSHNLILKSNENCKTSSDLISGRLFFYELGCFNPTLQFINIDLQNYSFSSQIDTIHFNRETLNLTEEIKLISVTNCDMSIIRLNFENQTIYYNLELRKLLSEWEVEMVNHQLCLQQVRISSHGPNSILNLTLTATQVQSLGINFLVNNNLITLISDKIIVFNNQFLNQTLNCSFKSIAQLAKLPFFISLSSTNEIILYKVNQYQDYFQHLGYKYIATIQKINLYLNLKATSIYEIETYKIGKPSIIISFNQTILKPQQRENQSYVSFVINNLQFGLPIQLMPSIDKDGIIMESNQFNKLSCNISNKLLDCKLQILILEESPFGVIYQNQMKEIFISDCQHEKQIKLPEKYSKSSQKIIVSNISPCFVIQAQTQLFSFEVTRNFELVFTSELVVPNLHRLIKEGKNTLAILFANCTIGYFNLKYLILLRFQEYPFSDCTNTLQFKRPDLFINKTHLAQNFDEHNLQHIRLINCQHAEFVNKQLLIFELSSDQFVRISVYRGYIKLVLLYQIPTYNFAILSQLYFVSSNSFLLIAAKNKNQDNQQVLLLYDLNKQVANCLQSITPIDNGNFPFDFLNNDNSFYFVFNNTLQIQVIGTYSFQLKLNKQSDDYNLESIVHMNITSQIPSNSQTLLLNLTYENKHYSLRFRQNIKKYYQFLYFDRNQKILQLNQIFGNIKKIELKRTSQTYLLEPINSHNLQRKCLHYYDSCCLNISHIVCDIYLKQLTFPFQHHVSKVNRVQLVNNQTLNIYYQDDKKLFFVQSYQLGENNELMETNTQLYSDEIMKAVIQSQTTYRLFFFQEIMILIGNSLLVGFRNNSMTNIVQNQLNDQVENRNPIEMIFLDQTTIILCQLDTYLRYLEITKLIIINDNYNNTQIASKKCSSKKFTFNVDGQNFILISHHRDGAILIIDLFFNVFDDYGYIYRVIIDLELLTFQKEFILNYIRFGYEKRVFKVLFATNDFIIIKISQQGDSEKKQIVFYDISQRQEGTLIDSIFTYDHDDIDQMYRYNTTHFVQVRITGEFQILNLITVDYYRIVCKYKCQNQYEVELINEISRLHTVLQNYRNYPKLIYCLIIGNFFSIVIHLIFINKRVTKQRNRIKNVQISSL